MVHYHGQENHDRGCRLRQYDKGIRHTGAHDRIAVVNKYQTIQDKTVKGGTRYVEISIGKRVQTILQRSRTSEDADSFPADDDTRISVCRKHGNTQYQSRSSGQQPFTGISQTDRDLYRIRLFQARQGT